VRACTRARVCVRACVKYLEIHSKVVTRQNVYVRK